MAKSGATTPTSSADGPGDGGGAAGCCSSVARTSVMTTTKSLVWAVTNLLLQQLPRLLPLRYASHAVPRFQYFDMMALVSWNHEGEGAHADRLAAGGAATPPRVGIEPAQQGEGRRPPGAELADENGEPTAVRIWERA